MKVAIIGSRDCGDMTANHIINYIPKNATTIVSGGAIGIDTLAREVAEILGLYMEEFLPNYKCFGKQAPMIRNVTIVDNANLILAFWDGKSNGTRHAVLDALKKDKEVKVIYIEDALKDC